ncbi:hypothetical protein NL676_029541 [Syzygium grande]|nr:hypothetical protein NL676_029541 [Syzygium grande]
MALEENGSEEKNKKKKKKQPWQGYGGTSWDDWTYHGVREITLEENGSEEIEVGPWGGNGGTSWDDGTFHGVREITLVFGHCINSICVVYDKNGMPVAAEKHGGAGGNQTAEIKLQSPDEYLVSVSGYYSPMQKEVCHGTKMLLDFAIRHLRDGINFGDPRSTNCSIAALPYRNHNGPDRHRCELRNGRQQSPLSGDGGPTLQEVQHWKNEIFDPNPDVLNALRGSGIDVTLGIKDQDLPSIASSADAAKTWFDTNVQPYVSDINFQYITAGNEVVPGDLAQYVLLAMQNLQATISNYKYTGLRVSTVVASSTLGSSYPPSSGVLFAGVA